MGAPAATIVQDSGWVTATGDCTVNLTGVAAGNSLIALVDSQSSAVTAPTCKLDTVAMNQLVLNGGAGGPTVTQCGIFFNDNVAAGAHQLVMHPAATARPSAFRVLEVAGLLATGSGDTSASANGSTVQTIGPIVAGAATGVNGYWAVAVDAITSSAGIANIAQVDPPTGGWTTLGGNLQSTAASATAAVAATQSGATGGTPSATFSWTDPNTRSITAVVGVFKLAAGSSPPSTGVAGTYRRRRHRVVQNVAGGSSPPASGFNPAAGVSVVSGSFADGQSITLSVPAGGLIARATPLPLYYWDFTVANGLTTHPSLSRSARTLTDNGNGHTAVTAVQPYPGTGVSCAYLPTTTSGGTSTCFGNSPHFTIPGGAGYQMYVQVDHYWDFPTAPANDKFLRGYSSIGGVGNTPDIYMAYGAGGNYILATENNDNPVNRPLGSHFLGLPITTQAWNTREHWHQENTLNVSDGIENFALNGVFGYVPQTRYGVCFANNSSAANPTGAGPMTQYYFDQYSSGPGPDFASQFGYFGVIYIDDSYLTAIISDEGSTYQTAVAATGVPAIRAVQIQTARADNQVTLTIRKGRHASLSGKNLFLTTGYMQGINLGAGA